MAQKETMVNLGREVLEVSLDPQVQLARMVDLDLMEDQEWMDLRDLQG